MESSFPDFVKEYIKKIDNRWVVAPNHDIFEESSDVTTKNMNDLAKISEIKNPWKRSKQLDSWHMMISEIKNPLHICLVVGLIFLILTTFPFNNNTKKFESPEVEPAIVLLGETAHWETIWEMDLASLSSKKVDILSPKIAKNARLLSEVILTILLTLSD
ncbi:20060_t:CDS:2 [Dentiscutata erythropus]|uniref:20060_t:CDS:1 n=1 Tax=Dentiscutata erythropus TaxID=1348616 RepID=A0A9N9CW34_9GLOM|nr:20060_t:CDS:2 [Dentiscutata erythropus]